MCLSQFQRNKYTKYDDALLKAIKEKEPLDEEVKDADDEDGRGHTLFRLLQLLLLVGCIVALVVSYVNWHSIPWAIGHSVLGWFYILYFAIRY